MTALTLRNTKGSPVTYSELDGNFTALDAAKLDKAANLSDVANAGAALANLGGIPSSQKGAASGVATLDALGKIPASQISGFVASSLVGAASGVAALDSNGKLPTAYLQSYVLTSVLGANSGVATLDSSGKVPTSQMPASYATSSYVDTAIATLTGGVANQLVASSKVLTPQVGLADGTQNIYFDATLKEPIMEVRGFKFKFAGGFLVCANKTRQILAATSGAAATFVVPAGVNFIFVKMWGAGGGGGSYGGWRQGGSGGGGGACNGWAYTAGGAGGGLCGEKGSVNNDYGSTNGGGGGTQTAGGAVGTAANSAGGAGAFNQGGTHQHASNYGGGGGGGYYGGASGNYASGASMGGGGGGSGFVSAALTMGLTVGGSQRMPGRAGDPDLAAANGAVQPYATGGEENCHGGSGLIAIYY